MPLTPDVLVSPEWQRRIDELAVRHDVPGAQIGLVALDGDGTDIRVLSTGVASRAHGAPVTARTMFHYGSISKVWTTTLLMQLLDEGRIGLDTVITDVLPDLRTDLDGAADRITVQQLLTHTSGIEGDYFRMTGEDDGALDAYLALIPDAQSVTAPGGPMSYCNTGFSIAGGMAAALRGALWDDLIVSRIAAPLGAVDVFTRTTDAGLFQTAVGHAPGADGAPAAAVRTWQLPRSLGPAGLIVGTADTLLRFAAAHLRDGLAPSGERILSADSARAMRAQRVDLGAVSTTLLGWGLGWMIADWGTPVVWHSGSTIGQNAHLVLFPELGVAVCVLTNTGLGTPFIAEVEKLLAAELGLVRPAPREDDDRGDVRDLIGRWRTPWVLAEVDDDGEGGVRVTIRERPAIDAGVPGPAFPLRALGARRFAYDRAGVPVEIARIDHDGREFLWAGRLLERVAD